MNQVSSQPPLPEIFQRGEIALSRGNLAGAEAAFRQVLAIDPHSAGAHANLGVIHMRRREWKQALAELRTAERMAPKVAGIRLNIGLVYYRQENFPAAIPPLESVLRDQPDSNQARHLLGLCYFFTEKYADAVSALEPMWPEASTDLSYLYVLAIAAGKAGRSALENKAMERLLAVGRDSAELHLFAGKAYLARAEDDKAIAELERAAEANSRLPFVHYNLGIAYRRRQDFARAKAEFLKDAEIEPDVAYNYDQLGVVCYFLEQDEEAERYYREALRREPRLTSSYFGLAKIYKEKGKLSQALAALESAGRLDSASAGIHYLTGQVLSEMHRREEAKSEFDIALRLRKEKRDTVEREFSGEQPADPQLTAEPR